MDVYIRTLIQYAMKTFFPKLFFFAVMVLFTAHVSKGTTCNASFTKSISGLTVTLTNTSTTSSGFPGMMTYIWNFGDATSSTLKNPVKTYSTPGMKTITLFVNDSFGCTHITVDSFMLVSSAPTCAALFTKTISGLSVTFNNTSTTSGSVPSAVYYNWAFSDGTSSTLKNPVKTFATAGTKTAQLTIYDSSTSCNTSRLDSFTVSGATSSCGVHFTKVTSGLTVTFTNASQNALGTDVGLRYYWYFSDGTSSALKHPSKTFAIGGVKTAELTITDTVNNNCVATKTDTITLPLAGSCVASFTRMVGSPKTAITLNSTLSTNSIGTTTGLTRYWYFSDGTSSGPLTAPFGVSYSHTFVTVGAKWVRLEITDTYGCTSSQTDTFTVTGNCFAAFSKSVNGLAVMLSSNSNTLNAAATKYNWSFSDGTTSNFRYPVKVFTTPGLKYIQHTVLDTLEGCSSTKTDSVYVYSSSTACSASFNSTLIGPLTMRFNSTSTNSNGNSAVLTYTWAFSDGGRSGPYMTPTLNYTFATPGMKWANLIITDSSGCTSSRIDSFYVPSSFCSANFTKTTGGLTVAYTNASLNTVGTDVGLTYFWYFNDGSSSTLKNPTKTYVTGGTKIAELTITDSANGCVSKKTDTTVFTSTSGCVANFTKVISGLTVTFTNTSLNTVGADAGLTYYWYFSDGTSSTLKNPVKTFATGGFKSAQLSITDSLHGCFTSKVEPITLSAPTGCTSSYTHVQVSPLTVSFTAIATNSIGTTAGLSYEWELPGVKITGPTLLFGFLTPGMKTVRLNITDSLGCTSTYVDSFMVTTSNCAANFTRYVSGPYVSFTNTSTNTNGLPTGLSYYWNFGDGTTSTMKDPFKTYTTGGIKAVQLTITDTSQGCSSSKTDSFFVSACNASFTKSISGLTVSLTNTSHNTSGSPAGLTYLWNFSDGTSSTLTNPVKTFATGGFKSITLTISDSSQGCSSSYTDTMGLGASPLCQASFSLAVDTSMPFHFFLLNTSIVRPTSTFYWTFGDGGTSTSVTPTHTYATFGRYYVCLTVADSVCTSTYCDSIGMDSTGRLLKTGAFGFATIDMTTLAPTTGVNEVKGSTEYNIYPNPTASDIHIDFTLKATTPITFQVTDITGKVIYTQTATIHSGQHSERIDIADLKPSIYFLNITSPDGSKNYKLIKN